MESDSVKLRELEIGAQKNESDRELKLRELGIAERKNVSDAELRARELVLAQRRLAQDAVLKRKEFRLQARQLSVGRWSGPVAVAVVGGLLGIGSTFFSSYQNREVERKKQEGTLILEAIRTDSSTQDHEAIAAANLAFLADAGLISLGEDQLKTLRKRAGNTAPSLPAAQQSVPQRMPDAVRSRISKSLASFGQYLQGIGAPRPSAVDIDVAGQEIPGMVAYYDPQKRAVLIGSEYLGDEAIPLREFAHSVLYTGGKYEAIDFDRTWMFIAIESGLASYFSSSYRNDPSVPPTGGPDSSLDNTQSVAMLVPVDPQYTGKLVWGGAFWELRTKLSQQVADRLLYAAWAAVTVEDIRTNDAAVFGRKLLATDGSQSGGKNVATIREVLARRGVKLAGERTLGIPVGSPSRKNP